MTLHPELGEMGAITATRDWMANGHILRLCSSGRRYILDICV